MDHTLRGRRQLSDQIIVRRSYSAKWRGQHDGIPRSLSSSKSRLNLGVAYAAQERGKAYARQKSQSAERVNNCRKNGVYGISGHSGRRVQLRF
ncbi:hypothetical protein X777_03958 [Ooceraea biroi]|uniref:Uncharacterized protein n=1 Tax=Ooceraea biroi TaxID=2015173 RepID=A0A026WII3_OOCBI|nr:hypothetical protein X777_03958 [Ooceraea biroi]